MSKLRQRSIAAILYCLLIPLTIISVGTLFWSSYPLELLTNFRVYYLLLATALAIACSICQIKGLRVKLALYLVLGLIALNGIGVLPWYLPHAQQASGKTFRVLTFNVNAANRDWEAIYQAVLSIEPDIAIIVESTPKLEEALSDRLKNNFPFIYHSFRGGIAIFSHFPLISPQTKVLFNGRVLFTSIQLDREVVNLIAAHPTIPVKPDLFKRRNAFLAELTAYIQKIDRKPLILLGDFNLTPWSPHYAKLVRDTKLHNTRLGFGVEPSWIESATHVHYPKWVTAAMKIPIDHIFISEDFQVSDCRTSKGGNSDHRMLWSDLVLGNEQ